MIALDLLDPYFSTDLSSILKKVENLLKDLVNMILLMESLTLFITKQVQEVLLAIHLLSPWASYLSSSKYSA